MCQMMYYVHKIKIEIQISRACGAVCRPVQGASNGAINMNSHLPLPCYHGSPLQ